MDRKKFLIASLALGAIGISGALAFKDAHSQGSLVKKETAIQTVLKHAQSSKEQVNFLSAELAKDHNIWYYDISFNHQNVEYEYEVNAVTGEIINYSCL